MGGGCVGGPPQRSNKVVLYAPDCERNEAMPMRYDKGPWIARVVACVKERFEGEVELEPTDE